MSRKFRRSPVFLCACACGGLVLLAAILGAVFRSGGRAAGHGTAPPAAAGGPRAQADAADDPASPPSPRTGFRKRNESPAVTSDKVRLLLAQLNSQDESQRFEARTLLARHYAETSPEDGIAWLQSLDRSDPVMGAYGLFARVLAERDPNWSRYLARLSSEEERMAFLRGGLSSLGERDPAAAWQLLQDQLPNFTDPAAFSASVFAELVKRNPVEIARMIDFNADPAAASAFFSNADFADQSQAAGLFSEVTDAEARGNYIHTYTGTLTPEELVAFGTAIAANTALDATTRSEALASVVNREFYENTEEAVKLVKQITDEALRKRMTRKITDYADSKGAKRGAEIRALLGM